MPSHYTQNLKEPLNAPLKHGHLHRVILDLAISYHTNFNLVFPALSSLSTLVQYARLLALPGTITLACVLMSSYARHDCLQIISVEVVRAARSIMSILEISFQFPVTKSRIFPVDYPEILLISVLIVATKICFPWKQVEPALSEEPLPRLDWEQWQQVTSQTAGDDQGLASRPDLVNVTSEQVVAMTEPELDEYFGRMASLGDQTSKSTWKQRAHAFQDTDNRQTQAPTR